MPVKVETVKDNKDYLLLPLFR